MYLLGTGGMQKRVSDPWGWRYSWLRTTQHESWALSALNCFSSSPVHCLGDFHLRLRNAGRVIVKNNLVLRMLRSAVLTFVLSPLQFSEYIHAQVATGKGKLAPGFNAEMIVKNMFTNQDRNGDGKVTAEEFKLKDQEAKHDEL